MTLSHKQRVFVETYLETWNATRAAIAAGSTEKSARVTGHRMLTNANIAAEIKLRVAERTMSADEVLVRLAEQARAEYSAYIAPNGAVDLAGLVRDGKAHLVKAIKETQHATNIEFYDAQAALLQIGKHHRLFLDGPTGDENDPIHIKLDR